MPKLLTYSESKTFKFSKQQIKAFEKLEEYNVNVSRFVRLAIAEKIKRDFCILNIIYYICIAVQL